MEYRTLGRTGLMVSALGFGCGSVGGLMVRGDRAEMVRAVSRAIELGINYFDTARIYGDGKSESNLGSVLKEVGVDVLVGTKVRLTGADMEDIKEAVVASVEGSLTRLRREYVDLIQLHNPLALDRQPGRDVVAVRDLEPITNAFQSLQEQGKARFWGINGLGQTEALHQAISPGNAYAIQACYNLLNQSAGTQAPPEFPFQDYERLIDKAAAMQMGVIAIRVLAGGALSGTSKRHSVADQSVSPIASGEDYDDDVSRAKTFEFLVQDGYADDLVEAAIRFAISKPEVSTALVGLSSLGQLEQAAQSALKGPLPTEALSRLSSYR